MGKHWDKALPDIGIFKECHRVLKPGAFAFVMSAPRSDVCARMMLMLEDAGFEIGFTPIYWTYACLSADTELYTPRGWQRLDQLRKYDFIGVYDPDGTSWKWESPSAWNTYEVAEDLFRIKSEETDQLVSRNHRVYTSEGLRFAEYLPEQVEVVCLPRVPHYFRNLPSRDTQEAEDGGYVLHDKLSAEGANTRFTQERKASPQVVARTQRGVGKTDNRRGQSFMEGWRNLLQDARELYWREIHTLSRFFSLYGSQGRLCYGASYSGGGSTRQTATQNGSSASHRPQSEKQQYRKSDALRYESGTQTPRTRKPYRTTLASVSRVPYRGLIYCPTVSTGVFLARRNGKIFLTGNSGFPKAMNIGKQVMKRNGDKGVVIGDKQNYHPVKKAKTANTFSDYSKAGIEGLDYRITKAGTMMLLERKPTDEQAKALDGSYGNFSPKPAVEVVIVAQKPRTEKTAVDQALAWLNEREDALRGIADAVKAQHNQDVIWDKEAQYHPKSA